MGGQPSQRSRKAELVDMIVELAGFGAEGAPAGDNAGEAAEVAAPRNDAAEEAPPAAAGAADGVQPGPANGSEPGADAEAPAAESDPQPAAPSGERRQGEQRRQGDQRGERPEGPEQRQRSGEGRSATATAERSERGDRPEGERGRWEDGGAEYGNRRRRRGRGRVEEEPWEGDPVEVSGYLDLRDEGYGFLRLNGHLPSREDVYVSVKQVRQFGLRRGDHVTGGSRPANRSEKNPALLRLDAINNKPPEASRKRPNFEDLTPLFPDQKLRLERAGDRGNMTTRIIDLISPIGKGQRGLIVSPPKAGKTTIMKEIARSIEVNNPEVKLIVLLVDERPEEVTDMRRWLMRGEVAASTFDRPAEEHTHVAELTIERAKRMTEAGEDVVIMLDGITRLARAYNLAAPATGRIMSGGVDSGALYPPKKFFGAARNMEEGGSLTILATALVETGSKMDEVIFEEFKGTGNMELRLDRRTAERRIYPAIDVDASSTRHEELLFERKQLQQVWKLRRVLSGLASDHGNGAAGLELLIDRLKTFPDNDAFLEEVARGPMGG
ncbi:MAG: transcription termination factor Rho [Acidimicrobiia bacterium]|nr:transcription termination factor Rho [Acidimicrobiia bacterium]MYC44213.1 transcription termination factor Rho [Acidimicrobiia bacterium]